MKKRIALALLLLYLFAPASRSQVKFGVMGGLNTSAYTFLGTTSDWKAGIHAGIFAQAPIHGGFGLEADLQYSQKGGHMVEDSENIRYTLRLNYLTLPVLLTYHVSHAFYIQAGPEIGLLLAASDHYPGGSTDVKQYYRSFDKGIAFGAGYQFLMGLGFGVRYIAGFKPVSQAIYLTSNSGASLGTIEGAGNNSTLQVSAYYTIPRRTMRL